MSERITIDISDHVAVVTLDRAKKRNAVDKKMFAELIAAGEMLQQNHHVRAVVITGSGEHFCSGIDVATFNSPDTDVASGNKMDAGENSPANFFQSAAYIWREVPVPVIAALQGYTFGAGFQIAMGADIRYAAKDVQMSIMEIKWGLIPDMAISATLRHVVATDKLRELCFTGRIVGGEEAADIGLVTAIKKDPFAAAMEVANGIAERSPQAIRSGKKLFNEAWECTPASALRMEAELQEAIMAGDDHKEVISANLERRLPSFDDPKG